MYYFVSLSSEPIWISWRAGQILLVIHPPSPRQRCPSSDSAPLARHRARSDGDDRWRRRPRLTMATRRTSRTWKWGRVADGRRPAIRGLRSGFACIRPRTRGPAPIEPRGRRRRSVRPAPDAAGRPISLLAHGLPERSTESDAIFAIADAGEAARRARQLRIDYVYLDRVEREAFGPAAAAKFDDGRYFGLAFQQGSAAVYAVR